MKGTKTMYYTWSIIQLNKIKITWVYVSFGLDVNPKSYSMCVGSCRGRGTNFEPLLDETLKTHNFFIKNPKNTIFSVSQSPWKYIRDENTLVF